jgi:hypothetical protein
MMRMGAAVASIEEPQEIREAVLKDGVGGRRSGEASVNGMKDRKLGNRHELDLRFSCCKIANIRNWRVI